MNHTYSATEPVSERDAAWFEEVNGSVARGRAALLARQQANGHWIDTIEDDQCLEAELILLLAFLGKHEDSRVPLAANRLQNLQEPGAAWGDVGTSVRAYLALKVAGHSAEEPHMRRAAGAIRALGGAGAADALTHCYLAMLGQVPASARPSVQVQSVLLPKLLGGIDAWPQWERAARVALGVIAAHEPVTHLPERMHIGELFVRPLEAANPRRGFNLLRGRAVHVATNWLRARYAPDNPHATFRALALNAVALNCLGVSNEDPEARWVLDQLGAHCESNGTELRVRPFLAPVSDTALSLVATADTGAAQAGEPAVRWLLEREARDRHFAPDTETTALVLIALARGGHALRGTCSGAVYRAINGLLATQNRDGGWPAFDRAVTGDPSCPALTALALEALGHFGFRIGQQPVDAAVAFVLGGQELSGSWRNRWGASTLQTTGQVLGGLCGVGFDVYGLPVRRAVRWLKESQNGDGSWGGSTPTETAWAVRALLAGQEGESAEVRAGVEFLVGTQHANGTWTEDAFTGTGVASGSKLKRGSYPLCFPLMALGRYLSERGQRAEAPKVLVRTDAGHRAAGPRGHRHTLAE